ncbi:hypothetical protein AAX10_10120 [Moraxella bovoculi]|nr:hypothetical protein AAX10_10120 [Moraxella bovoculi]
MVFFSQNQSTTIKGS